MADSDRLTTTTSRCSRSWPRTRFRRTWSSQFWVTVEIAKAVVAVLHDAGFTSGAVVAPRSMNEARPLAERYGFDPAVGTPPRPVRLLVNVTSIGTAGGPQEHDLSFARELVEQAEVVFDGRSDARAPARTPPTRAPNGELTGVAIRRPPRPWDLLPAL
jgi:hypothetical protein